MKDLNLILQTAILGLVLFTINGCNQETTTDTGWDSSGIDMVKARNQIDEKVEQFSRDFNKGDSVALANHYASDGTFGSIKGKDLVSAWGRTIRNAAKDGRPYIKFTTNSLFSDGEYLIELGGYAFSDENRNVKSEGKYLVVWKQEHGQWKMYRDIGM